MSDREFHRAASRDFQPGMGAETAQGWRRWVAASSEVRDANVDVLVRYAQLRGTQASHIDEDGDIVACTP